MKIVNFLLLLLLLWFLIVPRMGERSETEVVVYRDSIVRDTLRDTLFHNVMQSVVRYDTIVVNDTVYATLPISHYEFKDSSYRFVVEGYHVKPLLLETYPITYYRTKEITKQQRVTSGFQVGMGAFYGTKGLDVGFYAGYGLQVKF